MKNISIFNIFFTSLLLVGISSFAQHNNNNSQLLSQEPNFLKTRLKASDSLFIKDISVLQKFVVLDSVDLEILKPQILYTILSESNVDTVVTYKKLVEAVRAFKQNIGYTEFRKGILLYKQMAAIKVNPSNWENDQLLFRKLGFTEADLEDFLLFISKPQHKELNYKEAYLAYMKEIDSLQ
ncbi:MAG: hypothetical protein REI64_05630 [Pedobacter sp.]|uniref:hypothetical protein n=1 Tax=Pedobacter sp. TaxID=1411316 RepID=UPI0028092891|nr:hypothetical protein [Pedobacter sp.]MDQ8004260.1 hypothetical protein [Pedobacter sp.]